MFQFPPAPVNEKGKLLKGKKADSQGKQNMFQIKVGMKNSVNVFKKEIVVFKVKNLTKINCLSDQ